MKPSVGLHEIQDSDFAYNLDSIFPKEIPTPGPTPKHMYALEEVVTRITGFSKRYLSLKEVKCFPGSS